MPKHSKKPTRKQSSISELNDFHPLIEQWLIDNDYSFVHEYKMPDFGRVDYYAIHNKTGRKLLIECKCDNRLRHAIVQVVSYRLQIPEAYAVVAIPKDWLSDELKLLAERYEVGILEFDISSIEPKDNSPNSDIPQLPSVEEWEIAIELIESNVEYEIAKRIIRTLFLISMSPDRTRELTKELFELLCNRLTS